MKKLLLIILSIVPAFASIGQESFLDVKKYAPCELFAQKSGYDWQQRLSQIDSLENKEVIVYEIRTKDNKIKKSYSGKLENPGKNNGKPRTKGSSTVITVVVRDNHQINAYFPLTNNKHYRIYLKDCMK